MEAISTHNCHSVASEKWWGVLYYEILMYVDYHALVILIGQSTTLSKEQGWIRLQGTSWKTNLIPMFLFISL